ncbi:MAG: hypothetical protein ACI4GC_02065 [Acutalibacteraceae bacterium]
MKKILSVVMALVLMFTMVSFSGVAVYEKAELTKYPVILVPGYTTTKMYRIDEETGEEIPVWVDAFGQVGEAADGKVDEILKDAATYLIAGDVQPLAVRLGTAFNDIFGGLKCNPDGSSYYELFKYCNTPEDTNYANIMEKYPDGTGPMPEKEMMGFIGSEIGNENLYWYPCDFRMGAFENATGLDAFIDATIEYHNQGKAEKDKIDKVNIFAVSHGGQVAGTYLSLFGYKGKVNNAVLTVPALGGAGVAYDAFNQDASFDDVGLIMFLQHAFVLDEDLDIFVQAGQLGFLDELCEALLPICMDTIGYWGSLWDFIPVEYYDSIKDRYLDPVESAPLIEKSDFMHYEVMSESGEHYYAKGFKKAQDAGSNVYIMAGYDVMVLSGMLESSDALIPTSGATGATCAPYGQRFNDGYTQKVDTGFYQVSPSMTVDASTSYLPEHTWFIEKYFHGMTLHDDYTVELLYTLLLNDESYDVHTFERFPQFHATTNPSHGIFAAFDNSTEGYLSGDDTVLNVTNISREKNMTVVAANIYGIDLELDFIPFILAPGQTKSIPISGEIPEGSLKNFEINLTYVIETVTPLGERRFDFTLMNGQATDFDEENPLVEADYAQVIDEILDDEINSTLEKVGVKKFASMICNIVTTILEFVKRITSLVK